MRWGASVNGRGEGEKIDACPKAFISKRTTLLVRATLSPLVFTILLWIPSACGVYSFSSHGSGEFDRIAIEPFSSQIPEFGVAERITDALINRLITDRRIFLTSPTQAKGILKGVVLSLTDRPLTFTAQEQVTEYEVVIGVEVKLFPVGKSEPAWTLHLTASGSYPYRSGTPEERREGLEKAIQKLVQDIFNQLVSDW